MFVPPGESLGTCLANNKTGLAQNNAPSTGLPKNVVLALSGAHGPGG